MKINVFLYNLLNILIIISCHNKDMEKEEYYIYGTSEFKEKEKELKISLEEAAQIYANYVLKQDIQKAKIECVLDIIYEDNYIFVNSPLHYNAKTGYNISGVWVNGYTGEIKEKYISKYVKIPNKSKNINVIVPFQKEILKKK